LKRFFETLSQNNLTTDVSSIQVIISAVKRIANIFFEWWRGAETLWVLEELPRFSLFDGPVQQQGMLLVVTGCWRAVVNFVCLICRSVPASMQQVLPSGTNNILMYRWSVASSRECILSALLDL